MRNDKEMTITLKRIEVCDLLLACTCAKYRAGDSGEKWERLREKLKEQLETFDRTLDEKGEE